ncbi:1-phosphofructokinase family hexose kinase [Glutamicibacter protophormiae]|uniref:1-phosphofructokinase family hexose kinase n=1 Tax=Glutamicibacter protophormiae TaxID=37930 RepID=UPI003BB137B1
MILTLTPNPAIDETYSAPAVAVDASHRVVRSHSQAGGKGLNVARVLHSQDTAVHALFPAGGATGLELTAELSAAGIAFTAVPVAGATRRSMAFVDAQADTTTIFNEAGSALDAAEWESLTESYLGLLEHARAVAICGSWPPGTERETLRTLIRAAVQREIYTVVDTSGPLLLDAAACGAVLKPNHHELLAATGAGSLSEGVARLLERGAAEIYLSAGANGLYHFTGETPLVAHARLPRKLAGNPTGAGDSAVAALLSSSVASLDREATLRRAVAWSASTVLMPTAGALSPEHEALLADVIYRILPEGEDI